MQNFKNSFRMANPIVSSPWSYIMITPFFFFFPWLKNANPRCVFVWWLYYTYSGCLWAAATCGPYISVTQSHVHPKVSITHNLLVLNKKMIHCVINLIVRRVHFISLNKEQMGPLCSLYLNYQKRLQKDLPFLEGYDNCIPCTIIQWEITDE